MAIFKKDKSKKEKGAETIIGKIIYGFLLFMPLMSILVRCGYVTFNKNAFESYSDYTQVQNIQITNSSNLVIGNKYIFNYKTTETTTSTGYLGYSDINIDVNYYTEDNIDYHYIAIGQNGLSNCIRFRVGNGTGAFKDVYQWGTNITTIKITLDNKDNASITTTSNYYLYEQTLTSGTLDNAFEYSIDKTEESNLYNWAKDTGTYTVMHTTTTGLGITNTFVPMLMSYWLLISVIYFIFDIALILIWAVHRKIHELQESI